MRLLLALLAIAAAAGLLLWLSGRDLADPEATETYTEHDGTTWTWRPIIDNSDLLNRSNWPFH